MDNSKKKSIHHQIMMRRSSRSEYKDGLLRHNQRQENRLALELEQWEKAQRTVARGLDKESQWFKQTASTGYNPQRKRNSLTDPSGDGPPRFIPDYQYRNRTTFMAQGGAAEDQSQSADTQDNDTEKKSTDQTDASSRSHHKKLSKASVEGDVKKVSSRHAEDKKSSSRKSSKPHRERESRDREGESKRDPDKPASGGLSEKRTSSKTTAEASGTSASKPNQSSPQSATGGDKAAQHKASTRPSKKHQATDSAVSALAPATTTPDTTTTDTITDTTTDTTTTEDTKPSKTSSGARSSSICADVHDPGDVLVIPKQLRELGCDERRRYTNVWDNLSAPKHSNQVRSVRSRLQREFTQVPADSSGLSSSSKGFASARRAGRTPSLT